jgi:hypothetical protein
MTLTGEALKAAVIGERVQPARLSVLRFTSLRTKPSGGMRALPCAKIRSAGVSYMPTQAQSPDGVMDSPIGGNPFDPPMPTLRDRLQAYRDSLPATLGGNRVGAYPPNGQQPTAATSNSSGLPSAADVGSAAMQGLAGFNEGLGRIVMAPGYAVASIVDPAARAVGVSPLSDKLDKVSNAYTRAFVAPAGEPTTVGQQVMRASGRGIGTGVPLYLTGMGAAASGLRSGVTMAEQAAPDLVDSISAGGSGIASRLRDLANALRPQNIANAFHPLNIQGVADARLARIAAQPIKRGVLAAVRNGLAGEANREAQELAEQENAAGSQ